MSFEPEKFFIGVIDFFAILLPGALLTYVAREWGSGPLVKHFAELHGTEGALVFAFSSYLLGHFAFLLGAVGLDRVYDRIRRATTGEIIKRLADRKRLPWRLTRGMARLLEIKPASDRAVRQAVSIKEHYLAPVGAESAINAFQWAKARLAIENPAALASVQRFEADSKFFRSLVVVMSLIAAFALTRYFTPHTQAVMTNKQAGGFAAAGAGALVLALLAFWRYVDQRVKSTDQAYWYVITLESQRETGYRMKAEPGGPSHAGGVVWRRKGEEPEILLVRAKKAPHDWVLPKGHVEPGEAPNETAVREVREEAGVWARITDDLYEVPLNDGASSAVQFYLMEAMEEGGRAEPGRSPSWCTCKEAVARIKYPETQAMLKLAEERLRSSGEPDSV